jgi:hypothetical protein
VKYVVRAVPILAILAILLGVLQFVQPDQVHGLRVGTIRLGVLLDASVPTTFVARGFTTSGDGSRVNVVQLTDGDYAAGADNDDGPGDVLSIESLNSDSSTWATDACPLVLTEIDGNDGIFQATFTITEDADQEACDTGAGTPTVLAESGDRIKVEYEDKNPDATRRDFLIVENDVPDIANLTPDTGTFTDDEDLGVSVEVTDNDAGISDPFDVESIVFIISNHQCTDEELFSAGGDAMYTISSIAADSDLDPVSDLTCGGVGGSRHPIFELPFTYAFGAEHTQSDAIEDVADAIIGYEVNASVSIITGSANFAETFVGVIAVDDAGNVAILDVDETDNQVVLAHYTADTEPPTIFKTRTGVLFNEDDGVLNTNERSWIQVIFDDDTNLDGDSVDASDFVVSGHIVTQAKWFDEDSDVLVGEDDYDGTELKEQDKESQVRRMVFLKLADALEPDETPDVTVVPGGVQDLAGNIQSSAEDENVIDAIGPGFEVLVQSVTLAGEGDEVEIEVSSDEDLGGNKRPVVTVTRVDDLTEELTASVKSIGGNVWRITIGDPVSTGIFNVFIKGEDENGNANSLGLYADDADPADGIIDGFFENERDFTPVEGALSLVDELDLADISDDAIFFEGDRSLSNPFTDPEEDEEVEFRDPFFITVDFGTPVTVTGTDVDEAEDSEYGSDTFAGVTLTSAELDGDDVLDSASSADGTKWLIAIRDISVGDHSLVVEAEDAAGNALVDEEFTIEFTVTERAAFEVSLNPGWNLVSFPGTPAVAAIDDVIGDTPVTTVYSYDPSVPGGWLVAVRGDETEPFSGNLTTVSPVRGYWMLTDSFEGVAVDIPALAGGAVGAATPVSPPAIRLVMGWNLVPILDITGSLGAGDVIDSDVYFEGLEDEISRIYAYDTLENAWDVVVRGGADDQNIVDDQDKIPDALPPEERVEVGKAYWVYLTEAGVLIP